MQLDQTTLRAGALAFVLLAPVAAHAALMAPSDLAAGQGYRLAFLSFTGTAATSSDINFYNNFLDEQATYNSDLIGLASWKAILSTTTTDAVDNIACAGCNDVPIYMVDGTKVANSTAALFTTELLNAITESQYGTRESFGAFYNYAYTGSDANGRARSVRGDSTAAGTAVVSRGATFSVDKYWIDDGSVLPSEQNIPIYAISSELFVASGSTAVPEPATLALLGTGGLLAWGTRRRARRASKV